MKKKEWMHERRNEWEKNDRGMWKVEKMKERSSQTKKKWKIMNEKWNKKSKMNQRTTLKE